MAATSLALAESEGREAVLRSNIRGKYLALKTYRKLFCECLDQRNAARADNEQLRAQLESAGKRKL